jgi:UrcA family protein
MMTRAKTFLSAFAAMGLAATSPVQAAEHADSSIRIDYSDLDLGKTKDVRTLERRVARALERLCGSYAVAHDMVEIEMIDKCRAEAKRGVEPQLAKAIAKADVRLSSATPKGE